MEEVVERVGGERVWRGMERGGRGYYGEVLCELSVSASLRNAWLTDAALRSKE